MEVRLFVFYMEFFCFVVFMFNTRISVCSVELYSGLIFYLLRGEDIFLFRGLGSLRVVVWTRGMGNRFGKCRRSCRGGRSFFVCFD